MERRIVLSLACVFALAPTLPAAADDHAVYIGGTPISIPPPAGFHEVGHISKEVRLWGEQITAPSNRLLAIYLSTEDLERVQAGQMPLFERYMMIQTHKRFETIRITEDHLAEMKSVMKTEFTTLVDDATEGANNRLAKLADEMSAKLELSKPVPLGTFMDTPNGFGFAMLAPFVLETGGESSPYVTVTGTSILRVREKLVYAFVYGMYEDEQDIAWMRETATAWANAIVDANRGMTASPANAPGQGVDAAALAAREEASEERWLAVIAVRSVLFVLGLIFMFYFFRRTRRRKADHAAGNDR